MTHFAVQYIGREWVNGAQGPDSFDCWGFVRWIQREHFGRELPTVDIDAMNTLAVVRAFSRHAEHDNWTKVATPSEGDCVEMGNITHPFHVGVWFDVDGGGVLHCVQGAGVVFSSLAAIRLAWGKIDFWRHH
jgi:hypothetical protein